jgi:transposase
MKNRESHPVLGVDISKLTFDVAWLLEGSEKRHKFNNNLAGFNQLLSWLSKLGVEDLHVCMEATGRYFEPLAEFLSSRGYLVSVVNAAKIKGHANAELKRVKTDSLDASLIARFCLAHNPPAWTPQPTEIREVQEAERYLISLKAMRTQETNRLKAGLACASVCMQIETHIQQIDSNIAEIEKFLRSQLKKHEKQDRHFKLITSVIGVGEVTAFTWLGELGYCDTFEHARQLEAYAGLSTKKVQSGTSVHGRERLSKVGNHYLRTAFYMPAMSAIRCNPAMIEFKDRLTEHGKPPKLIVGAVMRKLLRITFAVVKTQKAFDYKHVASPPKVLAC